MAVEIVGDVDQRTDEGLVGGGANGQEGLAVGVRRHLLGIEAALGAYRHDDGVLDLLRLHQAQDLGAEILAPVAPADAAACDAAKAQMHAFDLGRIDEDLAPGARCGQVVQLARVQLEREQGVW